MTRVLVTLLILAAPAAGRAGAVAAQSPEPGRTTRTGVYAALQATRGLEVYGLLCRSCHTPASHAGPQFAAKWEGRPLSELFDYIRTAMPKSDPGSLTRRQYILVLAYLLKMNGMPAGPEELPADTLELRKIRIDLKAGADSIPER